MIRLPRAGSAIAEVGACLSTAVRGCAASGTVTEKREPRPGREFELHRVAEEFAEPVDDGEAETEPAAAVRPRARQPVELAENAPPLVLGNAGAGIADVDAQLIAAAAAADHDAALFRVAHGVGDKVEQDALQQDRVARHPGVARDNAQAEPLLARRVGEGGLDAIEQPGERELGEVGLEDAGLELGHVEQRLEQVVHRSDRGVDAADQAAALGRVRFILELGDEQVQRMQRLAQVVAGRGEKVRLVRVGDLQLAAFFLDYRVVLRKPLLGIAEHKPPEGAINQGRHKQRGHVEMMLPSDVIARNVADERTLSE